MKNPSTQNYRETFSNNEAGKTTTWCMLLCIALITGYVKFARPVFQDTLSPVYHLLIITTLIIITLFTLGCVFNLIILGDKSKREQIRDLKSQIAELRKFVATSRSEVQLLEEQAQQHRRVMKPRSLECLAQSKRILDSIERRSYQVEEIMNRRSTVSIIDAYELLSSDLESSEDCTEILITSNPVPPLPPEEWIPTIQALLEQVNQEIERIAA